MNWLPLVNSVVYSFLGLIVFCVGFVVIDKLTQKTISPRKE